jgi:hypothetical protein
MHRQADEPLEATPGAIDALPPERLEGENVQHEILVNDIAEYIEAQSDVGEARSWMMADTIARKIISQMRFRR